MRGNPAAALGERIHQGSIPACAGEPRPNASNALTVPVYPRVCGGTADGITPAQVRQGLSPRVRGNPSQSADADAGDRSIPACAGEPLVRRNWRVNSRVYPRVCGGTLRLPAISCRAPGLSPRVRGNRLPPAGISAAPRSIPACAGEPCVEVSRVIRLAVYPRVCGGTRGDSADQEARIGLSPRVRGNPGVVGVGAVQIGSIPACAGEPLPVRLRWYSPEVYPRVCGGTAGLRAACNPGNARGRSIPACAGEPAGVPRKAGAQRGLSPRVRGNRVQPQHAAGGDRSIPACAGEPMVWASESELARVYPRVCGGTYAQTSML